MRTKQQQQAFVEQPKKKDSHTARRTSMYNCLQIPLQTIVATVTCVGRDAGKYERFRLNYLSHGPFEALIFVVRLAPLENVVSNTYLLAKLNSTTELSIQGLTAEHMGLLKLKQDAEITQRFRVSQLSRKI
ncbi:hypothetical protein CRM22_002245 [Opisthorchis felineus]|uniref:Uncharacterized protein n=1 Tax=Opisthorchis felineus TaxID=147828 RepID=A0A4S2M716_OPIFE|nr:hypothetical protein CRM22_002245 [Opisthorchis felineus]